MHYARWVVLVGLVVVAAGCGRRQVADGAPLEQRTLAFGATIDFADVDDAALVGAIEQCVNEERREAGVAELATHATLRKAAARYAERMVEKGFLAHEDPTSEKLRTPAQRVAAVGGKNPLTAENIADVPGFPVGNGEPFYVLDAERYVLARTPDGPPIEPHTYGSFAATVVEGWMNSPGHRRNLLSPDAVEQGIGARMYLQNGIPAFVVVQKFQQHEALR